MYVLFEYHIKEYQYKGKTIELYRNGWYVCGSMMADTLGGIKKLINSKKQTK